MKTNSSVFVVTYNCVVFCVCSSFEIAEASIRGAVFELGLIRNDFSILERPLIVAI